MGMDLMTAKACHGWQPLLAGLLAGLLAAGSASSHTDAATSSLRAASTTTAQILPLPGTERQIHLPSGQQLALSSNGTVLNLRDSAQQRVIRSYRLPQPRINASVTMLPSGRVLIWGGADALGHLLRDGLWFDPQLQTLEPADDLTLSSRAGHTATVLTDGRVLFAGGRPARLAAELWDERDNRAIALADQTAVDRAGQSARLQADGGVRLSNGVDARNRPSNADLVFDVVSGQFATQAQTMYPRAEPAAGLAASLPAQGADDVMPDARLSLRFTQRLRMADLVPVHVTLVGPGGAVPVRIAPVEDGRLIFVQPAQTLFPDSKYTLMIDGAHTVAGKAMPLTVVDFKTAAFDALGQRTRTPVVVETRQDAVHVTAGNEAAKSGCPQTQTYFSPCRAHGQLKDGIWSPGQDNTDSRWRIYGPSLEMEKSTRIARIASIFHVTMVRGRVVRVDQKPVADVEVSIGKEVAKTDANGWFTLFDVPAGYRELYVDGTTAHRSGEEYGQFVVGVQVKSGQLNELPYLMHLPRISARDKIRIASPLQQDLVVGHPDIPGLELRIPKGTVIYDRKGRLVTELAIVPTPVNRAPFPVMENHPMAFTVEPGAAQIRGLSPTANNGIRVYYPNYDRYTAGTEANFWIYDPREGWRVYGKGTVSADGKHIVPERGVALHQTMGGMYSVPGSNGPTELGLAPDNSGACGCSGDAATAGDPIDLKTGEFTHAETDVVINDIVPITLTRSYRPHDLKRREFGIGTSWNWGYTLNRPDTNTYDVLDLVLPNGSSIRFNRISGSGNQGEWRQAGSNTNFSGASLKTVYDSDPMQPWGRAFLVTLRDGSRMQFSSYNDIRIRWIEDRYGNRTSLVYDSGLVTKIVSPSGRSLSIGYDNYNRIEVVGDQVGREWSYVYDNNGLLKDVVYPDTTDKHYTYQTRILNSALVYHRIESITDQKDHLVLLNEFEVVSGVATGRVVKQTQADGGTIEINYAHVDNGITGTLVTEPDGSQRRIVFDAAGPYPQSETLAYGTPKAQTLTYERNVYGQLTASIDPLGRRTETVYNADGQATQVTAMAGTPKARAVKLDYNDDGDLTKVTDPLLRETTLGYTNRCLTSVIDPLQRTTTLTCNSAGRQTSVTDPLQRTSIMHYDGYELTSVTDPLNRTVLFRYDTLGRLIATRDRQGNLTRREYDVMGRVKKSFDATGNATELGYDNNGNLEVVLLPNGNGITYTYDNRDRVLTRTDGLVQAESWTYDAMDRVDTYTDRKQQVTNLDYDVLGRGEKTTYHDGTTVTATFDAGNRLRTLVDTAATGTLGWDYNDFDEVIAATGPQGNIIYDYDAVGRRKEMIAVSQPKVEYSYDAGDRLQLIMQGAEVVDFDYDDANRLTKTTLPNGVQSGYAYNHADQLTGIAWLKANNSPIGDLGYGYNPTGQLIAQTGSFSSQTLPVASTGQNAFDDNNRQTQYNGQALAYDVNGNLTGDGINTYVWNVRDELTEIKQAAITIASFGYDALGRRYSKSEGGQTTTYLYDGLDVVQETQGATANPILTGLNIDQRFARNDNGGRTYFLTDALGSTRALTNASGQVVQRYDYTPYGQTSQTASNFSNPYQYTGREKDANGLYYYRARYYQSGMGRFIAEDPIGLAGGLNSYAYVGGNPVSYIDPLGLWGFGILGGGSAEAGVGYLGVGATGSIGGGFFAEGMSNAHLGGFASGGIFSHGPTNGTTWSKPGRPNQYSDVGAVGAFAGTGGGFFLTNADCVGQIRGVGETSSINIGFGPKFSVQFTSAYVNYEHVWLASITFGPGAGFTGSNYPTNTITTGPIRLEP